MDNIVILGSSGHAKVIIDIVHRLDRFKIVGLLDPYRTVGEKTLKYRVLGTLEDLPRLKKEYSLKGIVVAIGDNSIRAREVSRIRELCSDLIFFNIIHPNASIATNVTIGEGTVIMAGVSINSCSSVGRFCIVNTNSSLDHDSVLGDFSSLAPGVTTGGNCLIGEYSAISIGAVLVHGSKVGEHTVIGASSLVLKSIESFVVAYGTPARRIRSRKAGEKYL